VWNSELYVVRGPSMSPTFAPGDQLLVSRVRQRTMKVSRGDVVVMRDPLEGERRYLKRVFGLPSERIEQIEGSLLVNGKRVREGYLGGLPSVVGLEEAAWDLGEHQYFVLGDNRAQSTDSREFGPIMPDDIVGIVRFRYWPLYRAGAVGRPAIEYSPPD